MIYRNGNYTAFYVSEPFSQSSLAAHATKDFVYYNLLRAWSSKDAEFKFIDSHDKNYNVRDSSLWEQTLKPRIRERLRKLKNIILFLSSITKSSPALREEIDYGINTLGLPLIVIYPEFKLKSDIIDCKSNTIKSNIENLWNKLPIFRNSMHNVPTMHLPLSKELIKLALIDPDLKLSTKCKSGIYFYGC